MTQVTTLAAETRAHATKGAARKVRSLGKIPAVIYGDKKDPIAIAVEGKILQRYLEQPGFFTRLFDLEIDKAAHRVLPRDVHYDPVTDRPLHVDFLRVSANTRVRVEVPVIFNNADKSPGIKRGGTLNIVHHTIEVSCAPDKIPAHFEVNLEGLPINAAIHLSALKLPEGVTVMTHEKDFTIATIAVPSSVRSDADTPAEGAADAAAPAADAKAAGGKAGAKAPAAAAKAPAAGGKAPAAAAKAPAAKPAGKK